MPILHYIGWGDHAALDKNRSFDISLCHTVPDIPQSFYTSIIPKPAFRLSIVRDPVQHYVSHFYYRIQACFHHIYTVDRYNNYYLIFPVARLSFGEDGRLGEKES